MAMTESESKPILVGIKEDPFFDKNAVSTQSDADETAVLIIAAQAFAKRLNANLCLLSVLEENFLDLGGAVPWLPSINWRNMRADTLVHLARQEAQDRMQGHLDHFADDLRKRGLAVNSKIVTAKYAAEGVLAEAAISKPGLIMVSSGMKADGYFTRGISTPLGIMAEAQVPVMVLNSSCKADFSKSRLRILIADDLRDETSRAMSGALEWAITLGEVDALHAHIEELTADQLRRILGQTALQIRSPADHEKLATDLIRSVETIFMNRLSERLPHAESQLKIAGGSYRSELRRSPFVRDEIERIAVEFGADILIFGRHQKVHRRPFLVGRVTYQSMLSKQYGVLVFPG
jgi:nucleotide-binding universal stress UspA family protein